MDRRRDVGNRFSTDGWTTGDQIWSYRSNELTRIPPREVPSLLPRNALETRRKLVSKTPLNIADFI